MDISLLRIPDFKNLWTVQPSPGHISRRQLRGILDSFDYNGEYSPENDRLPLLQRAIAFVGFLLDQAQISQEYAGPFVGHRMDAMKCKYLAFCWVLGRYIRRLADAGVLEVRPDRIFRIYLSGCASKGIETFIRSTDARFLSKCNEAATRGYFENNPPAGAGAFTLPCSCTTETPKKRSRTGLRSCRTRTPDPTVRIRSRAKTDCSP